MIATWKRALELARACAPVRPLFVLLACGLLLGAGVVVLALRWVPVAFAYRPSDLGIVSVASLARYPAQQEIWYVAFACAVPLVVALGLAGVGLARAAGASADAGELARALACGARVAPALAAPLAWVLFVPWPGRLAALAWFGVPIVLVIMMLAPRREPPGAAAAPTSPSGRIAGAGRLQDRVARDLPLAVLAGVGAAVGAFLAVALVGAGTARTPAGWALAGALAGALVEVVAARGGRSEKVARRAAPLCLLLAFPYAAALGWTPVAFGSSVAVLSALLAGIAPLSPVAAARLVAVAWAAAAALDPTTVQRVVLGVPDLSVLDVSYTILAEHGQRLEWASRWLAGEVPGRDFLFLYGPLMLESIRVSWAAWGRSHAALMLGFQVQDLAGILCVLVCARALFRTRIFAVAALAGTVPLYLRSGVAGLGLTLLSGESALAWLGAGACVGFAALYSQEFAVAQGLAGLVVLAYGWERARVRALAYWVAGALGVIVPCAVYLHARGALMPMLESMVVYPRLMFAGFGKVPYPSLVGMLPLTHDPGAYAPASAFVQTLVGFYLLPMFYLVAIAFLAARRIAGVPVTQRERLMAGVVVFGLVSFRAGLGHSCLGHQEAILWPAVLIAGWMAEFAALRARAVVGLALLVALPLALHVKPVWQRFDQAWRAWGPGQFHGGTGLLYEWVPSGGARAGELARVVAAVKAGTPEGAPILALPNGSAYHFFTGRPNPTRYATFALLITREHRLEAVRALEARPPACVIYDLATPRLDNLPDRLQIGELLEWVARRYEVREVIGSTLLFYPSAWPAGQDRPVPFGSPEDLARVLAAGGSALPMRLEWRP